MISLFDSAAMTALSADDVPLCLAVEIIYPMGPVRLHSGVGELVIGGYTYKGTGALGGVNPLSQTSKTEPGRLQLSLSGLDPLLLNELLNKRCQGSPSKMHLVILDDDLQVASTVMLFTGRLSTQRLAYGETASIIVELVDRLADWDRAGTDRFSDASHQARQNGDRFFKRIAEMAERIIYWGSEKNAPPWRYN